MSIGFADATGLTSEQWAAREQVVRRFEEAWRHGPPPRLEDYLPAGQRDRRAVLLELVHTDLEYRLKDGAQARVEEYLARFPELSDDPAAELELITAERDLRRRREPGLALEEYWERFPQYRAELLPTRRGGCPTGTTLLLRRACPQCHEPLAVPADGSPDEAICPSCGAVIRLDPGHPAPGPLFPSRLGRYELLEELGRGSFGVVYRARDTELDRVVALKVPRAGRLATPEEVDRFLREARSAAQLEHPHIVAIHDAGRDGQTCYMACAFVPGTTLARHLAAGRLAFGEAAAMVARVAEALHHAHLQGVIHRDVKPANILLDRQGEPHLTDFGLAKRQTGEITVTLDGEVLGTIAYMSPEQAREAHHVDGRSDLYSLGIVLYEMLTGELPFRGSPGMVHKQVLEEEAQPPRRLNDRIPRDLETICLKCLEKEPSRRYATAQGLAEDLHRFLRAEPIRARPIGRVERLGRWCRRKPVVSSLFVLLVTVVVAGLSGVTWQWLRARREWHRAEANLHLAHQEGDRAEANFLLARQAVDDYLKRVSTNKLLNVPGLQPLRRELLGTALEYYRRFVKQRTDDPALLAELADAYFSIGLISSELESKEETLTAYQMALTIYQKLTGDHPEDTQSRSDLASTYYNMGVHHRATGQVAEALRCFQEALEIQEGLARDHPENPRFRKKLAAGHHNLGLWYFETGRPTEALDSLRRSIGALEELVATDPAAENRGALAQYYVSIGAVHFETGHPAEARGHWQRAIDILEGLTRVRPEVVEFRRDLAGNIMNLGALDLDARHPVEAIRSFRKALGIQEKLVQDNPSVLDLQRDLAQTQKMLGEAYIQIGDPAEALHLLEQARDSRAKLVRSDPANLDDQSNLGRILSHLGEVLDGLGRRTEALTAFREAIDHHRLAFAKAPELVPYRRSLSDHYRHLAAMERHAGRPAEAATAALERRKLWPDDPVELVSVAGDLAGCIPLVAKPAGAPTAEHQAQCRTYGDLAMDALHRAIARGFQDVDRLGRDPDLDPLRSRADFRQALMDLRDRTFPADPFVR